jgi:hypothetical protein
MLDPFKLFGRLLLAMFKIFGYTLVFLGQVAWFLIHRRPDRIGEAMGWYGKGIVDCLSTIVGG